MLHAVRFARRSKQPVIVFGIIEEELDSLMDGQPAVFEPADLLHLHTLPIVVGSEAFCQGLPEYIPFAAVLEVSELMAVHLRSGGELLVEDEDCQIYLIYGKDVFELHKKLSPWIGPLTRIQVESHDRETNPFIARNN